MFIFSRFYVRIFLMKELNLKIYGDSVLKQKAGEVKEITKEIREDIDEMKKIMTEEDGAGLAANQVGLLKRIIVIQTEKGPQAFINPRILNKSKETEIGEEGCLSFPGIRLNIKRAKEVLIEALNIEGEVIRLEAKGLGARVFQHEIDHLDGILFIDRLGFFQKLRIRSRLKQLKTDT